MSAPATHATPHDGHSVNAADAHATQAADALYYRQTLHALIDRGTGFARLLHDTAQAQAAPQAAPVPQPAAAQPVPAYGAADPAALVSLAGAFDQVARAVRRCILLAQHLAKPTSDPAHHRTAARKQIIRKVEDMIQRPCSASHRDADTIEALRAELHERLDAPDLDEDIQGRPVADIIQEIIRDLDLDPIPGIRPFKRRTPADVAHLNARAAAPSRRRQPGPAPQGAGLQPPQPQPPQPQPPQPQPPQPQAPEPPGPGHAALRLHAPPDIEAYQPRAIGTRAHPGRLPANPDDAAAFVLRQGAPAEPRWRQPPGG